MTDSEAEFSRRIEYWNHMDVNQITFSKNSKMMKGFKMLKEFFWNLNSSIFVAPIVTFASPASHQSSLEQLNQNCQTILFNPNPNFQNVLFFEDSNSSSIFQIRHSCRPSLNYRGDLTNRFRSSVKKSPTKSVAEKSKKSPVKSEAEKSKKSPVKSDSRSEKLNKSQIRTILWYRYLARWVESKDTQRLKIQGGSYLMFSQILLVVNNGPSLSFPLPSAFVKLKWNNRRCGLNSSLSERDRFFWLDLNG